MAADLSHIDTNSVVSLPDANTTQSKDQLDISSQCNGYVGEEELEAALTGSQIVIIPAGVPRKPGQ